MDQRHRKQQIREQLDAVRSATLQLLERTPAHYFTRRVHDFYSPIGWHFGHVGMTEEYWAVVRASGRPCLDERLSFLLANLPENPKDARTAIPDIDGILRYLEATRERTLDALDAADLDSPDPLLADGYAWEFAIQHECQHQETICELMQLISRQSGFDALACEDALCESASPHTPMAEIPTGRFVMGSDDRHGYDNEKRAHEVEVAAFQLDRTLVTSAQWLGFMQDGGYERRELWSAAGWEWRERENATAPEYWYAVDGGYMTHGSMGPRAIGPDEPVCSVGWYEADAYARWVGKRLPTEGEWEYAASSGTSEPHRFPWGNAAPDGNRARYGMTGFGPTCVGKYPEGASAFGVLDMAGNVWEWTSSPFLPYDGFEAFPYDGYSKEHMDGNHRVCRGGSWATAGPILRCSFRNWYVPTYRQGLLGLRCAL
jgi:iron(II)-dependent oxidoreductase